MADMTRVFLAVLVLGLSVRSSIGQQLSPDLLLLNGKIFTGNSSQPQAEALAIRGDRIQAVGTSDKILSLAGPQTKSIDLGERVVIPGINDAHYHLFVEPASYHLQFNSQEPTWREVEDALAAAITRVPEGTFIRGEVGPTILDDLRATRISLDKLAPSDPVMLSVWTQHSAILNSAALRLLKVRENELDPMGGTFVCGADGKLTGVVLDFAKFRLERRITDLASDEEALRQTRAFLDVAVRFGITSVQNLSDPVSPRHCVALFEKAPTPIRVRIIRQGLTTSEGRDSQEGRDLPTHAAPLVTVSGTKWILDGTPIERSAAMRQPYSDRPGTSGHTDFPEKEMEAILRESRQTGDQLLVHAVGDRTVETFLSAIDATGGAEAWSKRRIRIEHGDGLMPDLVPRAKPLGVVVVQNPSHVGLRELFLKRYGLERTERSQPLRSLLQAGIPLAFGSDAAGTVGPLNPYLNIMFASTYPGKPEEAITVEQAVIAYTLTSAYAKFAENDKGSLQAGKLADLAVLSQDIFHVPASELPKTVSILTVVGGKVVYDPNVVGRH